MEALRSEAGLGTASRCMPCHVSSSDFPSRTSRAEIRQRDVKRSQSSPWRLCVFLGALCPFCARQSVRFTELSLIGRLPRGNSGVTAPPTTLPAGPRSLPTASLSAVPGRRRVALRNGECPCAGSCPIDCRTSPHLGQARSGRIRFGSFTESHVRITHICTFDTLRDARQALWFHPLAQCGRRGSQRYIRNTYERIRSASSPFHAFSAPLDRPPLVSSLFSLRRSAPPDPRSSHVQERPRIRPKVRPPQRRPAPPP